MRNISRQIYFYDTKLQTYDKLTNSFVEISNYKEEIVKLFNSLDKLKYDKNDLANSRYLQKSNGTYDFIKIDEINSNCIKGKLINSDDSGLTYYEENGELKFLKDVITKNGSISEIAHFIIFLDTQIMAFEYNAKCSRAPSIKNYINTKFEGKYFIDLYNLQDKKRVEKFKRINKIKKFNFTTSSKFLSTKDASQAKGIFKAAFATLDLTQNETDLEQIIKIEMSPVRKKKGSEYPYYDANLIKNSILEFSNIENDEIPFNLDIVGYDELNEEIRVNYFKDIIVESIYLKADQVSSDNFYEKMSNCYNKTYNRYVK